MWAASSSTFIAEGLSTATCHEVAAHTSFYPELALRTLLIFGTLNKFFKFLIVLAVAVVDTILRASHAMMIIAAAS